MSTEFEQSGELRPGLFPEETAEEAVARIVAQNPQKHGLPVEERERRAKLAALRESRDLSGLDADDSLIVSVGGDPNEMMVGNKPRWTVDGDKVKDHLESIVFNVAGEIVKNESPEPPEIEPQIQQPPERPKTFKRELIGLGHHGNIQSGIRDHGLPAEAVPEQIIDAIVERNEGMDMTKLRNFINTGPVQPDLCDHSWPEDPDEETRCPLCQMTFADWVNS